MAGMPVTDFDPSPDSSGILFCCGRSAAEAVTKKIQWIAGTSF